MHANVARNHRCKTMLELLQRIFSFLVDYNFPEHCKPSLRTASPVAAAPWPNHDRSFRLVDVGGPLHPERFVRSNVIELGGCRILATLPTA